ncbi:ATP-dependent helicase NAM7 [Cytospora mali]|uniref:ATP-dependent helicase NAM7 n=1 Tax=Cytospora mali TaxID=578113 RepID=A0A194V4W8_CYTMA|nr:ATP-dependent helicase NAM7 [Valsa mali var. pyri (nom. inval.)]
MSRRLTPLYVFSDGAEYYRRHTQGTLVEFQNESREIDNFNAKETPFKTWVVAKVGERKERSSWMFLVRPGDSAGWCFPKEDESCDLRLLSKNGKAKKSKWWDAERVENPAASMGLSEEAHHLAAFEVKVPNDVPEDLLRPLQSDPDYHSDSKVNQKYLLSDKRAVRVNIKLGISAATKDAELGAVTKLFSNPNQNRTEKQHAAFQYLLDFKNPRFTVNMFNHFPHLRDPMNNPGRMPQKVVKILEGFNEHQIVAYKNVLSNLPCGICIIPGGPGAGKTHWNLVLTAAIQSKDVFWYGPDNMSRRSAKVLYILDINKPLDNTSDKIVLYKSLGLKKLAVRLNGWHYKGTGAGGLDFTSKFLFTARLSRYRRQTFNKACLAPTLDKLAWDFYDANKTTKYGQLCSLLARALKNGSEEKSEELKSCVDQLYRDVLARVDFIATTPVPASTTFDGLFKPEIVIFDESPHAREASTMLAIAHFEPIAWIFSGDYRQTRPFVASDDVRDNPWVPQMLVSIMERAHQAGAIRHCLLINHRAYGGLQRLASSMFYNEKMVSGHSGDEIFPPPVQHLQRYLERFMDPGSKCREPRLIAFSPNRGEVRVGTSWFNADHMNWVMDRVGELLPDPMFRQVGKTDRGTILIIAPYKEAYMKYKKAIQNLPKAWAARLGVERRLEARTIDTVQGGEADFVFLDLVRSAATDFTDDPNRLYVALTRARQAEVMLMHPGRSMRSGTQHLFNVFAHYERMGQVVTTDQQPRPMAQIPTEQRALENGTSQRPQIERERAEFGLEPRILGHEVSDIDGLCLVDQQEPESIFASQFADMAAFMEDMLAEKKRKQTSHSSTANTVPPGGQHEGVSPGAGFSFAERNPGLASSRWSLAGEEQPSTTDHEESTYPTAASDDDFCWTPEVSDQPMGLTQTGSITPTVLTSRSVMSDHVLRPDMAAPLDQGRPPEGPIETFLHGMDVHGEMRGMEARKKAGSLSVGQSWCGDEKQAEVSYSCDENEEVRDRVAAALGLRFATFLDWGSKARSKM